MYFFPPFDRFESSINRNQTLENSFLPKIDQIIKPNDSENIIMRISWWYEIEALTRENSCLGISPSIVKKAHLSISWQTNAIYDIIGCIVVGQF